jgi:uncharacterized protein YqjF (DUF2071 family)
MANYRIDPQVLLPYLPLHTELDFFKGHCYVSLVGFLFQDTKLKGIHFPMHVSFEEVNLRFYVHHTGADSARKRGVVFIKEIVPRAALSFVANNFYGEHYETLPMQHKWYRSRAGLVINYRWKKGQWHKIQVVAAPQASVITPGSEEEFITEHYWGYTKLRNGRTSEYEVVHPKWMIYPVQRYGIDVDFAAMYGHPFAMLTSRKPDSIFLAEGSEVTVRSGARINARI